MWNIIKEKLTYLSFYHFCLFFLASCFVYDFFIVEHITGFTDLKEYLSKGKQLLKG